MLLGWYVIPTVRICASLLTRHHHSVRRYTVPVMFDSGLVS